MEEKGPPWRWTGLATAGEPRNLHRWQLVWNQGRARTGLWACRRAPGPRPGCGAELSCNPPGEHGEGAQGPRVLYHHSCAQGFIWTT